MQDVSRGEGRTVLFVSHNMESVKNLCKTGIIMENGQIIYKGEVGDCVNHYLDAEKDVFLTDTLISDKYRKHMPYKQIEILSAKLLNDSPYIALDEEIAVELQIRRNERTRDRFTIEMMVDDVGRHRIGSYVSSTQLMGYDLARVIVKLKNHNLARGKYYLNFNLGLKEKEYQFMDYDIVYGVLSFEVAYISNNGKKEPIRMWRDGWGCCQFHNGVVQVIEQ